MDSRTNKARECNQDCKEVELCRSHSRRADGSWTTDVLRWIPREKKRPRRRPNVRWVDEIKHFPGATWMRIAADRDMWKGKGETFIQ